MTPEQRLAELNLVLPQAPTPVDTYVPYTISGNLLFLAGQGPQRPDGAYETGKVGAGLGVSEAYAHARLAGLNHLAILRSALGSLDRVKRILKVLGMVNAAPDFTDTPDVINGYSDLMRDVFGEQGRHARSAVGMSALPCGMSVEVETIVEITEEIAGTFEG